MSFLPSRLSLVPSDHPALWTPAQTVTDFTGIDALATEMMGLAIRHHGVGLAASQCGIGLRVFIARLDSQWTVCVNPEMLSHERDLDAEYEGCLSFPGREIMVERYRVIGVRYQDSDGTVKTKTLKRYDARVWMHEFSHTLGQCIFDRPVTALTP